MKRKTKPTTHRAPRRKTSDKFIVGMVRIVNNKPTLSMFTLPEVHDNYINAIKAAERSYNDYPNCKFVVFAKVATVGAPFLAPKVEEYKF